MYPFFYRQLAPLNNPKRKRMARALTWFTRTIIFIIYVLSLLIVIGQRTNDTTQVRQVAKHPRCQELVAQQAVQVDTPERR
jgi:hypothetical protein